MQLSGGFGFGRGEGYRGELVGGGPDVDALDALREPVDLGRAVRDLNQMVCCSSCTLPLGVASADAGDASCRALIIRWFDAKTETFELIEQVHRLVERG